MKILMVNPSASAGAFVHQMCNALEHEGARVELWTGPLHVQFCKAWRPANYLARVRFYKHTQLRSWGNGLGRPFWRVARLLGHCWSVLRLMAVAHRYDVIHLHFLSVPALDALWLPFIRPRGALAYTVHNLYPHDAQRTSNLVQLWRRIYHSSDILFVHTSATSKGLVEDFGIHPKHIIQVPLGNVCDLVRPTMVPDASSLALDRSELPLVLMLGDLRRNKGPDILLEAAAQLRSRGVIVRVLFAGRHPAGDPIEYRRLADRLGLGDLVEFRPHFIPEEEIPAYLNAATMVAFPYLAIDQSAGAVWALSYGRPTIATRVGGLVDLIEAGAAMGVKAGDAGELADAIEALLVSPTRRQRLGEAGRRYAQEVLAWKPIAQHLLAAYQAASRDLRRPARVQHQARKEPP